MRPSFDLHGIANIDGLYSYALVLTRDNADAEDLVQETYLRAMRAASCLREDSNLKAWLFTILRNIWFNCLRKRRASPLFVEIDDWDSVVGDTIQRSKDPLDIYISKVDKLRVQAAIFQLPLEFREIVMLREYEELSYREIASVLDCPMGTVMSRLARARTKLHTLLSENAVESASP